MPGAYSTINAQASRNKWNDFKVNSGPSTRRAIDLARSDWSLGILPHGNSGHLVDKFHNNQFKDYVSGKMQVRKMSFQNLNANEIESSQTFRP
jgi:penicillin amidase